MNHVTVKVTCTGQLLNDEPFFDPGVHCTCGITSNHITNTYSQTDCPLAKALQFARGQTKLIICFTDRAGQYS